MYMSRVTTRLSRTVLTQCLDSLARREYGFIPVVSDKLISLTGPLSNQVVSGQRSLIHHSALSSSSFQWFGFSSSASPQSNEKDSQSVNEQEAQSEGGAASVKSSDQKVEKDSDMEIDLSRDDLLKLVVEKEELLKAKQEEHEKMKDKMLRALAEMENVKDRTVREAENAKRFAIQNFAKSLLDVADNLARASSVAKESFSKIEASGDTSPALSQLKTLLEGVGMTEKQLSDVLRKFGVEKYDPTDEEFDPNRHNAVFQVPDASKPANRVAVVLKTGYMLHDRIIRPAEVGVTVAVEKEETDDGSKN